VDSYVVHSGEIHPEPGIGLKWMVVWMASQSGDENMDFHQDLEMRLR
jgi:hypothetical protein